jgi:CRISPR-associated protein Csb2
MMRWLCIEANLLSGRYHGRSEEGRLPEWPPNPHRVFQALIAAANLGSRRTEFSKAKKEAFRWLERCDPPEIAVPPTRAAKVVRLYVPNNDMDKVASAWAKGIKPDKQPAELRTGKDLRPHLLDGDCTIRFLWPISDEHWQIAQPHADIICKEARHLHSLGLGIDLAVGNGRILSMAEKRALPGEIFIPASNGIGWRVPVQGSYDELETRYAAQSDRVRAGGGRGAQRWIAPPAPPKVFHETAYVPRTMPHEQRVHAFALVDEDGGYRSFDPRRVIEVAAWLRHAAHEMGRSLGLDSDFVENFICGHSPDVNSKNDRFSYLPLPTISAKGRDGRIRRVLIAEPVAGGGGKALGVARRLSGVSLVADGTGEIMADLLAIPEPRTDGLLARYLRPSVRWGSVTPMVLPGRDDRRCRKAYGLVLKALAQAGYTTPIAGVHLQPEPVFPGAETARSYRVPAYLKLYPRTHAIITFAKPVSGPVALGGGRHLGLGVFCALASQG